MSYIDFLVIAGLLAAVPDEHKEFLRNLVWIHEQVCLALFLICEAIQGITLS